MLRIALQDGFIIYLVLGLGALVGLYVYDAWQARTHEWDVSEARLCRCPNCNFAFLMRRTVRAARCPRCQRLFTARRR